MIHIVTLARNPPRALPDFMSELKSQADYVWKVMPGVWLVDTPQTARQLAKDLREHIGTDDSLLVIRVRRDYGGFLPKSTWKWLRTSVENGDFE